MRLPRELYHHDNNVKPEPQDSRAQIHWSEIRKGNKGMSGEFHTSKDLTQFSKTITIPGGRLLASTHTHTM